MYQTVGLTAPLNLRPNGAIQIYYYYSITLNNASDYRTNGINRTLNPNPSPLKG